jgi:hypothetical protein
MKARNNKTRWLLIALLFGFLAVAGVTLTRHHGAPTIAKANDTTAPTHTLLQQPVAALLAVIGGKHVPWAPAGAGRDDEPVASTYSNNPQPRVTGHSGSPSSASNADPAGGSSDGPQPQSNRPSTPANHLPQNGAGEFVQNGNAPLDCELPAGCGAGGGKPGSASHQRSGASGAVLFVHNSQGSSPPNDGSDPPTNDGSNPPVASAPELDPATLAGAVTLLLGSLAVLRSRRVRATR